jgi:hypothetical protein
MQKGGHQDHRRVSALLSGNFFGMPCNANAVADPSEVAPEMALHLNGHPVLEQVFLLSDEFRGHVSNALLGVGAVGRTAEVHVGVQKAVAASPAHTRGIVPEKLHVTATAGALDLEDRPRFPVAAVLSRAFHECSSTLMQAFGRNQIRISKQIRRTKIQNPTQLRYPWFWTLELSDIVFVSVFDIRISSFNFSATYIEVAN